MDTKTHAPGTQKVRRDVAGGKRGDGHVRQREGRRVRRPDPRCLRRGRPDPSLTGVAGLVDFGAFVRAEGVDAELRRRFGRLKVGRGVVYPMGTQLRLLIDTAVVGEMRVFGLEDLAADPLFVHLAGGTVPSIDTVYRDLCRADEQAIRELDEMVGREGLCDLRRDSFSSVHLDIDTTVEVLFGSQEGALPGPNPRYHGRPSYHPILARCAETGTLVGAALRPGDTAFGGADADYVRTYIRRLRQAVGPETPIYTRIDGAADCIDVMAAVEDEGSFFITKADMTSDLCAAISKITRWDTVDYNADGQPSRQVAEVHFARKVWTEAGRSFRVIAVRSRDRDAGKQIRLWELDDYTVQAFITNERVEAPDAVAHRYDGRAGIESMIAELKGDWGIGKVPSQSFIANHAAMLIKMLAFNLFRRFVGRQRRAPHWWRTAWLRRTLVATPGRLIRRGRRLQLRTRPEPIFHLLV